LRDHGRVALRLEDGRRRGRDATGGTGAAGIDMDAVGNTLQDDGVKTV